MKLQRSNNRIYIYFGQSDWMTGLAKRGNTIIKETEGRRWFPNEKKWSVPDTQEFLDKMNALDRELGTKDRVDMEEFDITIWDRETFGEREIRLENTVPDIGDYL